MGWADGEIFLNDGSSKKGLIKLDFSSKQILSLRNAKKGTKFKSSRKAKKEYYQPEEIHHIVLENAMVRGYYEYLPVSKNKKGLFRVVTRGRVNLYQRYVIDTSHRDNNGRSLSSALDSEYHVKRDGETITTPLATDHDYKYFIKKGTTYFSDCPALVAKIKDGTYTKGNIKKVVAIYNECGTSK